CGWWQLLRRRGDGFNNRVLFPVGGRGALPLVYLAGVTVLAGPLGPASTGALAAALVSLYWPVENWLAHRRILRRGREASVALFQFLERPREGGQVGRAGVLPPVTGRPEVGTVSPRAPGSAVAVL